MSIRRTFLLLGTITFSFLVVIVLAEAYGFHVLAGMNDVLKP